MIFFDLRRAIRLHAQTVCQTDQAAVHWLFGRHYRVPLTLQLNIAQVTYARILETFRQLCITQCRLTELNLELGAEETLHVRKGHGLPHNLQKLLQAWTHHVPRHEGSALAPAHVVGARALALRALLFHHRQRAMVWYHCTIQVAQKFLLRNGELNYVANLTQRKPHQAGQMALHENLRAGVAATRKNHLGTF